MVVINVVINDETLQIVAVRNLPHGVIFVSHATRRAILRALQPLPGEVEAGPRQVCVRCGYAGHTSPGGLRALADHMACLRGDPASPGAGHGEAEA